MQSDQGEYEKNAREKQNIQIYKIKHQLPLKPSHKAPTPPQQNEKYRVVW
jgi:hypothetical protein